MRNLTFLKILSALVVPGLLWANGVSATPKVTATGFFAASVEAGAQEARKKAKKKAQDKKKQEGQKRQNRREDRRDTRQDRQEEVRDTRQDIREERRDTRQDVREERIDTRQDVREERRDNIQDFRQDRRSYNRGQVVSHYRVHRVGYRLNVLPVGYLTLPVLGSPYFYYSGVYYQYYPGGGYVVVAAPYGARLSVLPFGYRHFYIGPRRYYYVNYTYYLYEPREKVYVVVEKPEEVDEETLEAEAEEETGGYQALVMYPTQGQTEEQQAQDKYECHAWAVSESGYNPVLATDDEGYDLYLKATEACLEGRGYGVG